MLFIRLKNFLYSLSLLHVYIMKGKKILSNDFSEFIELIRCLCFYFVDMVYISWFLDIEPTLYFCDKSQLVMVCIIHCMCSWICFDLSYYFAPIFLFFWLTSPIKRCYSPCWNHVYSLLSCYFVESMIV